MVSIIDAQAQEGLESTDYLSPFNVIGSKEDIPNLEGTGSVLESAELTPFFHTDVNEILREVPGVYLRPEEGYGLFPNISLRGVDSHRSAKVTILEDGIPSSPSPFSDPAAYYSPTAGRMSGFEILKGSSQMKHGPNTTGGIVNYLSTPIPQKQKSHFRASYGEYNERIAHAYSGGKTELGSGRLGYLLEVFDHRTDGFKSINALGNAVGGKAPVSKNDITLKLGYEFGKGDYLELKRAEPVWMPMSVTLALVRKILPPIPTSATTTPSWIIWTPSRPVTISDISKKSMREQPLKQPYSTTNLIEIGTRLIKCVRQIHSNGAMANEEMNRTKDFCQLESH